MDHKIKFPFGIDSIRTVIGKKLVDVMLNEGPYSCSEGTDDFELVFADGVTINIYVNDADKIPVVYVEKD